MNTLPTPLFSGTHAQQLCRWWDVRDPIDQMRRRVRQEQYITRTELAKTGAVSVRHQDSNILGRRAERALEKVLARLGLLARTTSHKAAYDFVIEDQAGRRIKVELKAATWTARSGAPQYGRYKARLPKRQRQSADLVIFGCKNGRWHWFVIPTGQIRAGSLEITKENPEEYRGKYRRYLEDWGQVQLALEQARQPPRQLPLPG